MQRLAGLIKLEIIQLHMSKDPSHTEDQLLMDLLLLRMFLQFYAQLLCKLLGGEAKSQALAKIQHRFPLLTLVLCSGVGGINHGSKLGHVEAGHLASSVWI